MTAVIIDFFLDRGPRSSTSLISRSSAWSSTTTGTRFTPPSISRTQRYRTLNCAWRRRDFCLNRSSGRCPGARWVLADRTLSSFIGGEPPDLDASLGRPFEEKARNGLVEYLIWRPRRSDHEEECVPGQVTLSRSGRRSLKTALPAAPPDEPAKESLPAQLFPWLHPSRVREKGLSRCPRSSKSESARSASGYPR
jgi:hypothetical protein